uniref:Uncharacterized protein n=1 Tax=Trichobilharzia regenti TaxID=157069 RepID=A0AA85J6D5_TRIRE|nr:unnamed protein product [Trichobilharzia regenti]CAH8866714.1 unnamed protein product [Trichobilharzia regenti]
MRILDSTASHHPPIVYKSNPQTSSKHLHKKPTCQPETEHFGPINRRENQKFNSIINMTRRTTGGSRGPSGLVDNALAFETMGTGFEPRWEHHHSLRNAGTSS